VIFGTSAVNAPPRACPKHPMLRRRLGAHVAGLPGTGPQLSDAGDRRFVVEPAINEKAADNGRRAALAAPTMEVNDSAVSDFGSDTSDDPVVSVMVEYTHIRNGMCEVTDFSACDLCREFQVLSI
jgi:hypothetical protein